MSDPSPNADLVRHTIGTIRVEKFPQEVHISPDEYVCGIERNEVYGGWNVYVALAHNGRTET